MVTSYVPQGSTKSSGSPVIETFIEGVVVVMERTSVA